MADVDEAKAAKARAAATAAAEEEAAAEAERSLGRTLAMTIPAATVAVAIGVGLLSSAGPALLVLAGGALVGTITLLWASLRTLGGDAPLPAELEAVAARADRSTEAQIRKRTVLRALRDIENERAIGKIDDEDYARLTSEYREQAKQALRDLDTELGPKRAKAEELAASYLAKRELAGAAARRGETGEVERAVRAAAPSAPDSDEGDGDRAARPVCAKCATDNETDAAFCKKCGTPLAPEKRADDEAKETPDEPATAS